MQSAWFSSQLVLFLLFGFIVTVPLDSLLSLLHGVGRILWKLFAAHGSWIFFPFFRVIDWAQCCCSLFEKSRWSNDVLISGWSSPLRCDGLGEVCFNTFVVFPTSSDALGDVYVADWCCRVFDTEWIRRLCRCSEYCVDGTGTFEGRGDGVNMLLSGVRIRTCWRIVQNFLFLSLQWVHLVVFYWVACEVRVVSAAIVNHGILYGCSVLATIPRVPIWRHLMSFVDWQGYWDGETGLSESFAKQLYDLCSGSLSKYLSSGGLLEFNVSSVCPHLIVSVVCGALRWDHACVEYIHGRLCVKRQGHCAGGFGTAVSSHWCDAFLVDVLGEPLPLPSNFGTEIAPSSGPRWLT